jgi:hypothetical protein
LQKHQVSRDWYNLYKQRNGNKSKNYISTPMLNLIKYVVSSNSSISELENEHLRTLINENLKLPSVYTFRYNILPQILEKLKLKIEEKLKKADYITLIPDGWSSNSIEYFGNFFYIIIIKQYFLLVFI